MDEKVVCNNCHAEHTGKFCNTCGEKILEKRDFSLPILFSEAIGSVTNFDSKLIISFKKLFFRPGEMSRDIIDGKRISYVKPFQIFLIANILFFILLPKMDLFRAPAIWYFPEDLSATENGKKLQDKMDTYDITRGEAELKYDNHSSNLAKSLLILIIPVMALYGWLTSLGLGFSLGKTFIYSIHIFTFFLLIIPIIGFFSTILPIPKTQLTFLGPILLASLIYSIVSFKKFFKSGWLRSSLSGIVFLALTFLTFFAYRDLISQLSLNTM